VGAGTCEAPPERGGLRLPGSRRFPARWPLRERPAGRLRLALLRQLPEQRYQL